MRVCRSCKETKPLEDFWVKKNYPEGRDTQCGECSRTYHREHYHRSDNRKQQIRINNRSNILRLRELRDEILAASKGCQDCGITNILVLTFDHRDPKSKQFDICNAILQGKSWKRIKEEIDKCDIVCANCHLLRTRKMWLSSGSQTVTATL